MNIMSQRIATLIRSTLTLTFILFGALFINAQTSILPRFQVNFVTANEKDYGISFRLEDEHDGSFDLVVMKENEEIFHFRSIDSKNETLYSFVLINDKFKALEGLNKQATLTTFSNFGPDIISAYESKDVAFIGILECMTPNGAISRLQVTRMVSDDEAKDVSVSDATNK